MPGRRRLWNPVFYFSSAFSVWLGKSPGNERSAVCFQNTRKEGEKEEIKGGSAVELGKESLCHFALLKPQNLVQFCT